MSAFSDYFENQIINHMLRNQAFTPPSTVYLALFTAVTGLEANNPSAEVSGGSYARMAVTLDAASGGATQNSSNVDWTTATGDWGTVTHVAVVDHLTNTTWGTNVNVLMYGALTQAKTVNTGDTFRFLAGDLDITVA